jgi:hypothetical protein
MRRLANERRLFSNIQGAKNRVIACALLYAVPLEQEATLSYPLRSPSGTLRWRAECNLMAGVGFPNEERTNPAFADLGNPDDLMTPKQQGPQVVFDKPRKAFWQRCFWDDVHEFILA